MSDGEQPGDVTIRTKRWLTIVRKRDKRVIATVDFAKVGDGESLVIDKRFEMHQSNFEPVFKSVGEDVFFVCHNT